MKYHGRSGCKAEYDGLEEEDEGETAEEGAREEDKEEEEEKEEGRGRRTKNEGNKRSLQGPSRKELVKHDARCVAADVNATLDFTLNCNSVRLTSRDMSLKTATRAERQ